MTTDEGAFLAALRLADSALPVGAYTASYGFEQYVNEDRVEDADDLRALATAYLRRMVGPAETVALANAHRAGRANDVERLRAVDERLHAVMLPREFRESSTKAGRKLCELVAATGGAGGIDGAGKIDGAAGTADGESSALRGFADGVVAGATPGHYAVAFGVVAQRQGIDRGRACLAQAYAFVTGLLGAAQRLGRFGHTEIQDVLGDLLPVIEAVCARHVDDDLEAMASFAPLAEIQGMRHERADRRLFMS